MPDWEPDENVRFLLELELFVFLLLWILFLLLTLAFVFLLGSVLGDLKILTNKTKLR